MDDTIRWGTTQSQPILMIPGPTELPFPVVQAMSQPATIQYDLNFDVKILEPVTLALRDIFQTARGEVIAMPGSGRTALEASAISAIEPGDRVLVVVAGVFGSLMREIMTRAGAEVTEHNVEWGHPLDLGRLERDIERVKPKAVSMVHNETSTGTTYPAAEVGRVVKRHGALFMLDTVSSLAGLDVRTDDWGVDFNMTGSQKCLAAPLGMAIVSVSPAAWESMERRKHKSSSWAYDLLRWKENWIPASRGGHIPDGSIMLLLGLRWRYLLPVAIAGGGLAPLLWTVLKDYQRRRILVFLNPDLDPLGASYHIAQSKIAVGSGGFFGKGWLAASQSQLNFLPMNHTDFLFAVLSEQWGFVGALIVLLLYTYLVTRGFQIASESPDFFATLLATGITCTLAIQVAINVSMVLGILPVVGIPLPLLSYGGSSMLVTMLSLGLLLNIHMRRFMY